MRALHYTSVLALHHAIFRRLGGVDKHQAPSSISPLPTDALGADPGAHPCAQRRPGRDLQSSPRLWRRMPALELRLVDGGAWSPSIRTACRPPGHQSRPGAASGGATLPGRVSCRLSNRGLDPQSVLPVHAPQSARPHKAPLVARARTKLNIRGGGPAEGGTQATWAASARWSQP